MAAWHYEIGGKKYGPIPSDTLRHLAEHQAIKHDTLVWKDDLPNPVRAEKVKNLFPTSSGNVETVRRYLTEVLNAEVSNEADRLKNQSPALHFFHSSTISSVIVAYDLISIQTLAPPKFDPSIPIGKQTKPVRQLFLATVQVTLCDRPNHGCTLSELHRRLPGKRKELFTITCKEFCDGEWLFIDASVTD